jgi:hypothetical protein
VSRLLRPAPLYLALILGLLLPSPAVWAANGLRQGFGFNGSVSGFPTGAVALTGGGAYDPTVADNVSGGFVHAGGGFGCTEDLRQGPLSVSLNAASALLSSKIVKGAMLKVIPCAPHGMCTTLKHLVNDELLAFIKA